MYVYVCLYQGRKQLTQTVATEVKFIKLYSHIVFGNIMTSLAVNFRALSDLLETIIYQAKPTQSSTPIARLGGLWRKAPSRSVPGPEPVFWRASCSSTQSSPNMSTYDTGVRSRCEMRREVCQQSRDGFLSVDDAQRQSKSSHLKEKFKKKAQPLKDYENVCYPCWNMV